VYFSEFQKLYMFTYYFNHKHWHCASNFLKIPKIYYAPKLIREWCKSKRNIIKLIEKHSKRFRKRLRRLIGINYNTGILYFLIISICPHSQTLVRVSAMQNSFHRQTKPLKDDSSLAGRYSRLCIDKFSCGF
jgi:hypothetical protein